MDRIVNIALEAVPADANRLLYNVVVSQLLLPRHILQLSNAAG